MGSDRGADQRGSLIIIGGAEDKKYEQTILREFVRMAGGPSARLVIFTTATELLREVGDEYTQIFRAIAGDTAQIETIDIENRQEASQDSTLAKLEGATGAFFTGGDQLRITHLLGGTLLDTRLHDLFESGLVLAGTSAGASMMSSIMIIQGPGEITAKVGMTRLGAGMEFLPGVIVDQHFAQRGRINRLLASIAQFPHHLGIGIDENTAIIVKGHICHIIGEGCITVLDAGLGRQPDYDDRPNQNLSIGDVRLHLLSAGHSFDLRNRKPIFSENELRSTP